jgi:hypothetical protein
MPAVTPVRQKKRRNPYVVNSEVHAGSSSTASTNLLMAKARHRNDNCCHSQPGPKPLAHNIFAAGDEDEEIRLTLRMKLRKS